MRAAAWLMLAVACSALAAGPSASAEPATGFYGVVVTATATASGNTGTKTVPANGAAGFEYRDGQFLIHEPLANNKVVLTLKSGGSGCWKHANGIFQKCYTIKASGSTVVVTVDDKMIPNVTDVATITIKTNGKKCEVTAYARKYVDVLSGKVILRWSKPTVTSTYCKIR